MVLGSHGQGGGQTAGVGCISKGSHIAPPVARALMQCGLVPPHQEVAADCPSPLRWPCTWPGLRIPLSSVECGRAGQGSCPCLPQCSCWDAPVRTAAAARKRGPSPRAGAAARSRKPSLAPAQTLLRGRPPGGLRPLQSSQRGPEVGLDAHSESRVKWLLFYATKFGVGPHAAKGNSNRARRPHTLHTLGRRLLWLWGGKGQGGWSARGTRDRRRRAARPPLHGWRRGKTCRIWRKDSGWGLLRDPGAPAPTDGATWAGGLTSRDPCAVIVVQGHVGGCSAAQTGPPALRGRAGGEGRWCPPGQRALRLSAPPSERSAAQRGLSPFHLLLCS